MFGPSGEDRPDILTDAETVVLPVWLHRRASAEKPPPDSFLKTITVPAQAGRGTRNAAEPATNAETASGAGEAGTAGDPADSQPAEGQQGDPGQDEAEPVQPADAKAATEAGADTKAVTDVRVETGAEAEAGAAAQSQTEAGAQTEAETGAQARPGPGAGPGTEAEGGTTEAEVAGAAITGPDAGAQSAATRADTEVITKLSLADLRSAIEAKTVSAKTASAKTVELQTVKPSTGEASTSEASTSEASTGITIEAIDGLEARTAEAFETADAIEAIEAKTAEALEAIEAMTADALQAIDVTTAEIATTVAGELAELETDRPETSPPQAAQPKTAGPQGAGSAQPDRTEAASSPIPGTDVAQPYVISIDEPPVSVTLTTSATETTIAVPQPRSESVVAVTPAPAAADTAILPLVPQRTSARKPGAIPSAEPTRPAEPEAEPPYDADRRRTRISRLLLLCILVLQAVMSLRLHNTAFEDESLYIYSGHMELQHLLHGTALQGQYASYFSGSPVLYPVAAGFLNGIGGLTAARMLSLAEMLSVTALLYSLTRRLFNERIALCAAALFSVCESAIFLGNFATYDATCLFLLASAAWIVVRTAGFRWPVFLMAAPVAALAVGVKYAGLLFVPTIAVLPAVAGWPLRGRKVLLYPPAFVAAVGALLYGALKLGGKAYMTAISSTTTNRVQGVTPVATLLRETAEWGGVIFVLALIGTAAYVHRVRAEPEELIAPAGDRLRRLCLGVLLSGTALLAPAYQMHLHTDISFQKHIGFGLFFAAPIAGLGLARILGDHLRRPHIAVGIWSLALVLGLIQSGRLYQVWPNSTQFVRAFSQYIRPHARYLVEVPEVPIYYLLGHADAQPRQFTSTFYINYVNKKKVVLSGTVGFTAAVDAGYFHVVAYDNEVTAAADAVLAQALSASKDYYLAAEIHITDVFGPGDYFIWVKGHPPEPRGVFAHASPNYPDLGTKVRELAP